MYNRPSLTITISFLTSLFLVQSDINDRMRFVNNPIKPEFVIANRYEYCRVCGCSSLIVGAHPRIGNRSSKWNKIVWLLDLLMIFDTVVWLDYDAFILKPDCALLSASHNFNIAVDAQSSGKYNSGVLVTKRPAIPFLTHVWNHSDFGKGISDQNSINHLLPTYRFGILAAKYNDFGPPPQSCPGYTQPIVRRSYNQSTVIIRHRAGQFKGSRTLDGKVVRCAYEQIDWQKDAKKIKSFKIKTKLRPPRTNVGVLTVIA